MVDFDRHLALFMTPLLWYTFSIPLKNQKRAFRNTVQENFTNWKRICYYVEIMVRGKL